MQCEQTVALVDNFCYIPSGTFRKGVGNKERFSTLPWGRFYANFAGSIHI